MRFGINTGTGQIVETKLTKCLTDERGNLQLGYCNEDQKPRRQKWKITNYNPNQASKRITPKDISSWHTNSQTHGTPLPPHPDIIFRPEILPHPITKQSIEQTNEQEPNSFPDFNRISNPTDTNIPVGNILRNLGQLNKWNLSAPSALEDIVQYVHKSAPSVAKKESAEHALPNAQTTQSTETQSLSSNSSHHPSKTLFPDPSINIIYPTTTTDLPLPTVVEDDQLVISLTPDGSVKVAIHPF